MNLESLVLLGVGITMLFFGRRFFFLVIGLAGFLLGYRLTGLFFQGTEEIVLLLIGVLTGFIFSFLSTRFFRFVVSLSAFVLMGIVAQVIAESLGMDVSGWSNVIVFLVGGLVGLGLEAFVFDVGIIVITALAGSLLAVTGLGRMFPELQASAYLQLLAFILAGLGIFFQLRTRPSG